MTAAITTIQTVVAWYKALPRDFIDVSTLMYSRQRLAGACFEMAAEIAEISRQYVEATYRRKSFESRRFVELKDASEGKPIASHIEAMVRHESAQYAAAEATAEAEYKAAKIIYDAASAVLESMAQHISLLKQEKFETR